jgi:3-oxoacyl-(acyl-carrier-protein) synthase
VGVFGWGAIAPKSPDIDAFARNLAESSSWLAPFEGFGPNNFLAGTPDFQFARYQPWIDQRFPPRHYQTLVEKMDLPTQYALGAFIQALGQNPGLEQEMQALGSAAHVYLGTGIGNIDTIYHASIELYHAQLRWDRFWSEPEHNSALRASGETPPPGDPEAEAAWRSEWMERSPELSAYLAELAALEDVTIDGPNVDSAKLSAIREKEKRRARVREKWQAPEAPWNVSPNVIWNLHNTPAAQVSILGRIHGLTFAPVAACSTFGVSLKLAMDAIRSGEAKIVVVGATDPPPHPLVVGAFYSGRVLSAGSRVSLPLSRFRGTHVSGGAAVWIVGDLDYLRAKGFHPMGMEPVAVGVSSDAYHIITPSADGPPIAIRQALDGAHAAPEDIGSWDTHTTATPGDFAEISTLRSIFPDSVLVTARKGTFGHGMSAGGGWELTAQYMGYERGSLFPTPLSRAEFSMAISGLHERVVFDQACDLPAGLAGKLSMGIGGINACVISRPLVLPEVSVDEHTTVHPVAQPE